MNKQEQEHKIILIVIGVFILVLGACLLISMFTILPYIFFQAVTSDTLIINQILTTLS